MRQNLLVAASLFLPSSFFIPIAIFYLNPDISEISLHEVLILYGAITLTLLSMYVGALYLLPSDKASVARCWTLALAVTLYAQTHVLSARAHFDLKGDIIDWSSFGIWPFVEIGLLVLIFIGSAVALIRYRKQRVIWVANFILFASLVSLVPDVHTGITSYKSSGKYAAVSFDNTVFSFSSTKNVVHLMPDGVQADIAMEVLRRNMDLAAKFDGFALYASHLGAFPGTAPTLPTIFNGEMYDLSRGYAASQVEQEIQQKSFANYLSAAGVRLDFAPIVPFVCTGEYSSCVPMTFNDLRSRGYETFRRSGAVSLALLADLALVRQLPIVLKRYVYSDGNWWISRRFSDSTADYKIHAPVLEEWRKNMYVADAQPRYKWYHWIGSHAPPQWNRHCNYLGPRERSREGFLAQTECVLSRIAQFIERLRELGIYDKTMIIISSDHGGNEPPDDMRNYVRHNIIGLNELGTARPLLMLKLFSATGKLRIDDAPTSLIDIAPTILDAMEVTHSYKGKNVFKLSKDTSRAREYHRYNPSTFRWEPNPIPVDRFVVRGNPRDWNNWTLAEIVLQEDAPRNMPTMTGLDLQPFIRGISFEQGAQHTGHGFTVGSWRYRCGRMKVDRMN